MFLKMFTGPGKKNREMDWQLVSSYFTVKSTDIFLQYRLFTLTVLDELKLEVLNSDSNASRRERFTTSEPGYHILL